MQVLNSVLRNLSLPRACLVALLFGALNVLSFAPFFIWPLQVISASLMMLILVSHPEWNKKQQALLGLSYGFGSFVFGVCWLVIAMSRYGGMPYALSVIALALLAAFMAIFPALCFVAVHSLQSKWKTSDPITLLVLFPVSWTVFEFLRGHLFTGFPWLSIGYAHNVSPLVGFAPVVGVYGVGGIAMLTSACIALLFLRRSARSLGAIGLLLIVISGIGLQQLSWTEANGKPISVRLTQGNIDQGIKFTSSFLDETLAMYADLMTAQAADLIATPETALPLLLTELPSTYLPRLQDFASQTNSRIVIGVVSDDGRQQYSNSVIGLGDKQGTAYRYDKHHLVPFGEYVPFGFRWFVNMMQIPLGEYNNPGVVQPAMAVKDQWVMPNICYEDLFGEEIAQQLRAQAVTPQGAATILLNVSNLAWFGDLTAIPQHLQISQMRSLETGRPMLRSTNTGATAIIDARGQVVSQLPSLTRGTLAGQVQGMRGLTPYIRFGNWLWMVFAAMAMLGAYIVSQRQAKKTRT
ncbi:apolipoprotein N-acyltransferase [Undibacterium sp. LX15W]|uniref:Apolipoprotein N-acyltransferase n=1 Tax=Undibacterium flavidum TaxID=2762297 RepID=A0ABR6Y8F4_9BURK|nr:apolipoprotein N-acyltransferase [Undibacterium flavidum]